MVLIRACMPADIASLERADPSGYNGWHQQRLDRQLAAVATYLVAFDDGVPVGNGEIRWTGCVNAEIRTAYPDCPEINGLHVYPSRVRGRGIGTALIRDAEARAKHRRRTRIGLGVGADNPRAAALYARLGYRATIRYVDTWSYIDDDGGQHSVEDPCTFLMKDL